MSMNLVEGRKWVVEWATHKHHPNGNQPMESGEGII